MIQYLYRNFARQAIATVLLLCSLAAFSSAQIRDRTQHSDQQANQTQAPAKKTQRGPRAIAVLEFLPGGAMRLVPVALWIDDRFYDASLYGANPEPMALQPDTLYEATDYGETAGFFTVTTPEQVKGNWVGSGHWKPHQAMDEKLAQQAAKQPKPTLSDNPADDRPVLHRAASSGSASSNDSGSSQTSSSGSGSSSAGSTAPNPNEPSDRPTLKKPSSDTSSPTTANTSAPSQQPSAGSAPASPAATASTDESDPNRPLLKRGKPTTSAAASQSAAPPAPPQSTATQPKQAVQAKLVNATAPIGRRSYPAVSDATPHETRSLLYTMNSAEQTAKSEQMRALAMDEIRKFIAQRKTAPLPKTAAITDYDLRAFDLEYSNSPTLVFTATLPVATAKALGGGAFNYFVTLVAHEDTNGTPIKIFSSVTDSNHLDSFARMEIIDAVDADANGRGDLLFRQYSDVGVSYSLYRVYPYDMHKVFEGGSGA